MGKCLLKIIYKDELIFYKSNECSTNQFYKENIPAEAAAIIFKEALLMKKPQKEKKEKKLTPNDILKYEIANELGLMDKINARGWKSLTAKESGRIGGLIAKANRDRVKNKNTEKDSSDIIKGIDKT